MGQLVRVFLGGSLARQMLERAPLFTNKQNRVSGQGDFIFIAGQMLPACVLHRPSLTCVAFG
jgi:hypothetical protein